MKKHLTTLLATLMTISSFASPIDEATAKRYAENFWKENRIMGVRNGKVFKKKAEEARFVNIATRGGYSEFYIFNNEIGKGFVIVSADDCVTPILGYSYDNNFVVENMPDNVKGWMDGYAEQIRYAVNARLAATEEIREEWRCLQECKHLPIKSETAVNPLITTRWNQNQYYNMLCPSDPQGPGGHSYAGCVACAMAQIMKYWNSPTTGFGYNEYVWHNMVLSADFSQTYYDWDNMPQYLTSSSSNIQKHAVAELMYHCGISVNMNYGINGNGSGAYGIGSFPSSEYAYKTFFDFDNSLLGVERDNNYTDSEWKSLLKTELNSGRPIQYGGGHYYEDGWHGHEFICDGYDSYDYFHFNWGWGGNCDDYYHINELTPNNHIYDTHEHAILGVKPNNTTYNFDLKYYNDLVISNHECPVKIPDVF